MKKFFLLILLCGILNAFESPVAAQAQIVSGKISSQGKPLAGVSLTDGYSIVFSDAKGAYQIACSQEAEFVYYTSPNGYEPPIEGGVPVFYKKIEKIEPAKQSKKRKQHCDFELIKSKQDQEKHVFITWADPQVIELSEFDLLQEVVADMQETMASYPATTSFHAICAGDIVFDRLNLYSKYKEVISPLNIPFYQSVGNHDMDYNERSHELSTVSYKKHFGPDYYSFNKGKIHYVVLNDVFYFGNSYQYMGYLEERQLRWLEQDLSQLEAGTTVILTVHIPTSYNETEKMISGTRLQRTLVLNNKALYKILEPYNTHILAGHTHTQSNNLIKPNIFEHIHAAACGAWWQGEISTDGSPKSYTVYEIDGDKVSWYLKGVGMDKKEQFKLYNTGADIDHLDCFIANVYNYDPAWKVQWFENDVLMGDMQQYWGVDPDARAEYQAGKNKKYSWLSYTETNHLFRAKKQDPKALVKVVVSDRFGNVYTQNTPSIFDQDQAYKLVWNEEFDYEGLPDSSKWSYDTEGNASGWGNNELQHYSQAKIKNAEVSKGSLKIWAHKEDIEGKKYSSARLTTKGKGDWLYGKFEIRAKMPKGRGLWPAIWMLPTDWKYGGWPESGEIDIMEHVGYDPDTIVASAHTKAYYHSIGTQKSGRIYNPSANSNFHIYSLEWEPKEYRVYQDGVLFFTYKNEKKDFKTWPFDQRFHMLLNLAVGGDWGGKEGVDEKVFPLCFEIDYVRVYQKK